MIDKKILAESLYFEYARSRDFKRSDGGDMDIFSLLPNECKDSWMAVAEKAIKKLSPLSSNSRSVMRIAIASNLARENEDRGFYQLIKDAEELIKANDEFEKREVHEQINTL